MRIERNYILAFLIMSQMWLIGSHFVESPIEKAGMIGMGFIWIFGSLLIFGVGIKYGKTIQG